MKTDNTWRERYELEKDGNGLLLTTQGDSNYVFEMGNHSCGDALAYGMHVHRQGDAGGVISLDEVIRLRDFLNKHIALLVDKKWWEVWK